MKNVLVTAAVTAVACTCLASAVWVKQLQRQAAIDREFLAIVSNANRVGRRWAD